MLTEEDVGSKTGSEVLRDLEDNCSEGQSILDYEELASFSKYNIGEDGTQHSSQVYEKYAKVLGQRVRSKLERKAAEANWKA